MKQLAIYVLTYNRPEFVSEALTSILNQTFQDYDLYISDNSTKDDTMHAVNAIVEQNKIKYIRRVPSLSATDHFNKVLEELGNYEFVMLSHDDDLLHPTAIEKIMQILVSDKSLSGTGCNSLILKNGKVTETPFNPYLSSDTRVNNSYDLLNHYLTKRLSHIPFPFYIYRTAKIHGLTFDFLKGGKHTDVSFLAEAADRGPLYWIAEPLASYRKHESNDSSLIDLLATLSLCKYIIRKHPSLTLKAIIHYFKLVIIKYGRM
jgi:glycosyltransferase involved in cell wall biosynthesis